LTKVNNAVSSGDSATSLTTVNNAPSQQGYYLNNLTALHLNCSAHCLSPSPGKRVARTPARLGNMQDTHVSRRPWMAVSDLAPSLQELAGIDALESRSDRAAPGVHDLRVSSQSNLIAGGVFEH
jgi:hypothetical protein